MPRSVVEISLADAARLPYWASPPVGLGVYGSLLAHVNRRYHWHVGRLWFLLRAVSMLSKLHREACERIIRAEMRDVTEQFNAWKEINGYAASR